LRFYLFIFLFNPTVQVRVAGFDLRDRCVGSLDLLVSAVSTEPPQPLFLFTVVNCYSVIDFIFIFRPMPELYVHVHPVADVAALGDKVAAEGAELPAAPGQARVLPRTDRQAHRPLLAHSHRGAHCQSRWDIFFCMDIRFRI
jgi:hypothetical protein